jgi:hypothetical protein
MRLHVGVNFTVAEFLPYRLQITDQLFKSYVLHVWCVHNRLFNAYYEVKFKKKHRIHSQFNFRGFLERSCQTKEKKPKSAKHLASGDTYYSDSPRNLNFIKFCNICVIITKTITVLRLTTNKLKPHQALNSPIPNLETRADRISQSDN